MHVTVYERNEVFELYAPYIVKLFDQEVCRPCIADRRRTSLTASFSSDEGLLDRRLASREGPLGRNRR